MTTETVYNFLKVKNRPYSANDVSAALDKEKHPKSAVQKSLDKLVDNEKVFVKINGKQKVYCVASEEKQSLDELKKIERELQAHSNEQLKKIPDLEKEVKMHEAVLNSLKCGISFEEAQTELHQLQENSSKLSQKLDELMEATGAENMAEVKKKVENDLNIHTREYSKRKKICNEILDCILENYPGSKKQLYSEIGITEV